MNFRTTLILIGLLALVAGLLVWRGTAPPPATATTSEQTILNMREPDVRGFTITSESAGRVSVVLVDRVGWMMTDPVDAIAEKTATENYLRAILALKPIGEPSQAMQSAFKPSTVVTLALLQGRTGELAVSQPNAVGEIVLRYTVDSRARWFLVDRGTLAMLTKGPSDFREARLVSVKPDDIGLITLEYDNQWVRLTRDSDGWGLDSGTAKPPELGPEIPRGSVRADPQAVRDLLDTITSLRVADPLASAGANAFALPQLVVTYTQFGATTQPLAGRPGQRMFRIGRFEDARKERVVASADNPPVVGYLAASLLQSLRKTPLDLRDKQVLSLKPADITTLRLTLPNGPTTAWSRAPGTDGPAWRPEPPADTTQEADTARIQQVLDELSTLRATRYLEPQSIPADATPVRLEVVTSSGTVLVQIGKDALRVGDLVLESPTDLWELTQSGLAKPPVAVPFAPATQPAP